MDAKAIIMMHEGVRLKPYRDTVGKLTIGYGRNLDDVGISQAEAEAFLENDIAKVEAALAKYEWFGSLSPNRKVALIDMAFNMGVHGLLNFTEMIAAIKRGDYAMAARCGKDSKWYKQLENRAEFDMNLLENG